MSRRGGGKAADVASDPIDGLCRRARIDRSDLPPLVDELTADEQRRLADLFHRAVDGRNQEFEDAVDEGLGMVPRPLRRPVKKALGL